MKNLRFQFIIILLISNALVLKAQTNVYQPFPDSANYFWGVKYYVYDELCMCTLNQTYIDVLGDTMIVNGITYRKFINQDKIIRQDIPSKKIYARRYGLNAGSDTLEYLLYDFGLSIGDSISLRVSDPFTTMPGTRYLKCTEIDSINTATGFRKRLKMEFTQQPYWSQFTNQNYDYWVEGIGSMFNVFYEVPACLEFECTMSLGCFGKYTNNINDADSIYGLFCNNFIFVGIDTPILSQNEIVFADNKFRLKDAGIIKELVLMDPIGRVILQSTSNASEIELPKVASGIYIVQIKTQDKLFTKKVYTN